MNLTKNVIRRNSQQFAAYKCYGNSVKAVFQQKWVARKDTKSCALVLNTLLKEMPIQDARSVAFLPHEHVVQHTPSKPCVLPLLCMRSTKALWHSYQEEI